MSVFIFMLTQYLFVDSGRYEEIVEILSEAYLIDCSRMPATLRYSNGNASIQVPTGEILKGIAVFFKKIRSSEKDLCISAQEMKYLDSMCRYYEAALEIRMHNFANKYAHRQQPDETEIELIRAMSVLCNLLNYITMELFREGNAVFDVPEGWKRLDCPTE